MSAGGARPRRLVLPPAVWFGALVAVPLLIVLRMSLSDPASRQPPYQPQLDLADGWSGFASFLSGLDLENFVTVLTDPLYLGAFVTSLRIALAGALLTLLIGYPMALAIARCGARTRGVLLALVILPFWTSFLIRVYAWIAILKPKGLLNHALLGLGLIATPLEIL
ncbi:MAG: ABC transporter permease, partial [Beijerinckiaceae bacterium]